MQLRFFNSLGRKVEDFKPIKAGQVGLYTCGPTVYDHVHIGNLRTYISEDILRRTLKSNGLEVTHVMNITDVDDKTIKRSQEKYPGTDPIDALEKLTDEYENLFFKDAAKVGIDLSDSKIVKATEHIHDMQELIKQIPYKYITKNGIFFDTLKYSDEGIEDRGGVPQYGILTQTAVQGLATESRLTIHDEYEKHEAIDFALWKSKKPDEPSWEFDIDRQNLDGRPGWHIECSAMSVKYLGQPFDIHTGGVDLIFPHHENEIAQSRAAAGKPLANCFIHAEHLLVDGRKMSKSLKNYYALDDILAKKIDPLAFRLLVLQAHYRHQLNFTWEALDGAQTFLNRLRAWADLQFQPNLGHKKGAGTPYAKAMTDIQKALNDDLNTGQALAVLSSLASAAEQEGVDPKKLTVFLEQIDERLGLGLSGREDISNEAKSLIAAREEARSNSDWTRADELRKKLLDQSIEINDTPHGPVWFRGS